MKGKSLTQPEAKNLHDYLVDCKEETFTTIILRMNDSVLGKLSKYKELIDKIIKLKKDIKEV